MIPKVLFIINSLAGGGAERVMITLLSHSERLRAEFDFRLVLLDDEVDAYSPPEWLAVHRLNGRGDLVSSALKLRAFLQKARPDVTFSFLTRANIANTFGMAGSGKPVIISERVHTSAHLGRGASASVAKLLVRLAYPRAARVVAVSKGVGDHLVECYRVPSDRVTAIPNPFDLQKLRTAAAQPPAWRPDRPFIMAMGRLVETKNFGMLIQAYAASGIKQDLVISGEGPLRPELTEQARSLGVHDRVHLPGFTDNPFSLVRAADCFVLSSNAEGFPNALVEAMALGRPVIATDCPSGPSEILDGAAAPGGGLVKAGYGVLTPPGDAEAMTAALRLMADGNERERFGRLSSARADDFDVGKAVSAYWDVVRSVLN